MSGVSGFVVGRRYAKSRGHEAKVKAIASVLSQKLLALFGEKGPQSRGSMSLFGFPSASSGQALRLRLSQETAPNSAQDDEFNDENH